MALSRSARYNFVYQTKNLVNGKTYVGVRSTENIDDGYIGCGCVSDSYARACVKYGLKSAFLRAVVKYGYDNFKREILSFYDTLEECYEEEAYIVNDSWVKCDKNYNSRVGGLKPPNTKITDEKTEAAIFADFMSGMQKKDITKKYGISEAVVYRITKNKDTSKRKIKPNKRVRESQEKIEKYRKRVNDWYLSGKTKEEINKLVPFDLHASGILDDVKRYVAIKDDQVWFFDNTKDLQDIPGFKGKVWSHVKPTIDKKQTHSLGYKIVKHVDYLKGVVSYTERKKRKSLYSGRVLYKKGVKYTVGNSLKDFAKQHNLDYSAILRVLNKESVSHKDFTLNDVSVQHKLKHYGKKLINVKTGQIHTITKPTSEESKDLNLSIPTMIKILNKKAQIKNWRLYGIE
jgi:Mor family transcriptional regulator